MSIEDRLTTGGSAWRESQQPVTVSPLLEVRRKPVLWLPLTAAAATVAVVLGASLLVSREDSPAAPVVIATGSGGPGLESDAPPPLIPFGGSSISPKLADGCRANDVTAQLTTSVPDGTVIAELVLERTADAPICQLAASTPRLELLDEAGAPIGEPARYEDQPVVVNPPRSPRLLLAEGAPQIESDIRFEDVNCPEAVGARLSGLTSDPIPVALTGRGLPCVPGDQRAGRMTMALLHATGDAHGLVPANRDRLAATVEVVSVDADSVEYVATLTNSSDVAVLLDPCPRYAWLVESGDGSISAGGGLRVDCAAVKDGIPPGGRLEMSLSADASFARVARLTWGIAGTENATDDVGTRTAPTTAAPRASAGPGTTSLRGDLDDDGRPDLAFTEDDGRVVVITAAGRLPAVDLGADAAPALRGVLPLPGRDGLLVTMDEPGISSAQHAVVLRIVGDELRQLRYTDGDREPVELLFNSGRADQWSGVRCTGTGVRVLRAALETSRTENVVLREQELVVTVDGVSRGEVTVQGALEESEARARTTAALLAATSCPGLDAAGLGTGPVPTGSP